MEKSIDEVREIPINFAGEGEEAESKETGEQPASENPAAEVESAPQSDADVEQASEVSEEDTAPDEAPLPDPRVELQAQIDLLAQEKAAIYEQMLRRQAEFENFRKRIERERAEIHQRARAEVILEL